MKSEKTNEELIRELEWQIISMDDLVFSSYCSLYLVARTQLNTDMRQMRLVVFMSNIKCCFIVLHNFPPFFLTVLVVKLAISFYIHIKRFASGFHIRATIKTLHYIV